MAVVDIIMPCYNGKEIPDIAYKCIDSIIRAGGDFNLIITCSDKSQPENVNRGLEIAKSPYICVIDNDIIVHRGWIDKMVYAMESDPKWGIIGPNQAGKYAEYFDGYVHDKDEVIDRGSAIGAMMFARNLGLRWDENFKSGYWCDSDFGRQYKEKGYKIGLHGGVTIEHDMETTLGKSDYVTEMMEDGEMVYFLKWGDNFV